MGSSLQIQTAPVESQQEKVQNFQKNVTITYKRQLLVGDQLVNVLGEGGIMVIQLNNDGSLFNAGKVWREVIGEGEWLPIKPYERAFEEALDQIKDPQRYKLNDWNWGYKEMDGNVEQDEMRVYYQFNFIPVDSEAVLDYPPISIEILAQEG